MLADRVLGLKRGRVVFDMPLAALDDHRLASLYRPEAPSVLPPMPSAARWSRATEARR